MIKQTLHENWTVRSVGDLSEVPPPLRGLSLPAHVPGCIHTDLLDPDATVNQQLVTLLPNESFTVEINSKLPLMQEQLTSPPVLRCVNPFGFAGAA